MRISGPGPNEGFTLVELLIVLAMIGLLSAAVVIALPDPRGSLIQEAEQFAARAKAAEERAILDARSMSIRVTDIGYGFDRREHGAWVPIERKPFATWRWNEGTRAVVGGAGAARIVFDPTGMAEPARVTLIRDGKQASIAIGRDGTIHVGA